MFRKTSPQSSFFEVDRYFPDALPGDDRSVIYKQKISPMIDEEKFRHLYVMDKGRHDESIRTMLSLLIFMGIEKYTWRGAEFQFSRRIDWMLATNTPPGKAHIDHSTLFRFYGLLSGDDTCMDFFVELANAFVKSCGTSLKK